MEILYKKKIQIIMDKTNSNHIHIFDQEKLQVIVVCLN